MTQTKTTKKALIASVFSLVICVAMLVGSTFAWFTDSASTGINNIKAGNLKVAMYYADGKAAVEAADWKNAKGEAIFDYNLWEPGYTVAKHIKISNEGNLALKYQLDFILSGAVGKLAEAIDVYFADPAVQVAQRTDIKSLTKKGTLKAFLEGSKISPEKGVLAGGDSVMVTIVLKMQEDADNNYKNTSVGDGLTIRLNATQNTVESDSFDNQYDKDALMSNEKSAATAAELSDILANPDGAEIVYLQAGSTMALSSNIPAGVTLSGDPDNKPILTVAASDGVDAGANSKLENVEIQDSNTSNGRYYEGVVNLRGDGATLENTKVVGKGATTWDAAVYINLKSGETAYLKNTEIIGGFRGVFLGSQSGNVVIDGCVINPSAYVISVDGGSDMTLDVKNSTLNGWLSFSAIKKADFTGCTFGSNGSYAYFRPYSAATLTNCNFETGYEIDSSKAPIVLDGCTLNGEALTTANAGALFDGGNIPANVTIK